MTKKKSYSDRKRRVQWTPEAVRYLLQLWRNMLPELQNTKRNAQVYTKMSLKMIKCGFNFSAGEVKVKLHNLTNKYKDECRQLRCGKIFESEWCFYKPLDYILGGQKSNGWKNLMAENADPLYDMNVESVLTDGDEKTEDAIQKIEHGESELLPLSVTLETNGQCTNSSSDIEINDEQSEVDLLSNSEASEFKQKRRETYPESNDNSNFRIVADSLLDGTNNFKTNKGEGRNNIGIAKRTHTYNSDKPVYTVIPRKISKESDIENPNAHALNLARWEFIQLQKAKAKQEIEYQRLEFEQKTREHKLRLRHMEEEHELRMMSLRNNLNRTSNSLEISDN